jgi:RNA polymerase sigma-70 factor (ECF subfamily)
MEQVMTIVRSGAHAASPEDRFRGLFNAHYGAIYSYCARRLGTTDAADAAADVFTVAWRRIGRVPDEPETLPWLYGVARKVVSTTERSRRRSLRLGARLAATSHERATEFDPSGVEALVASLRPADREILMLAAWEGLSPEDLGRVLGCSANAAAVRLHRARRRLDEAMGGNR